MSGMYVRDRYLYNRSRNDKFAGPGVSIPGRPHFVVPDVGYDTFSVASALAWATENQQLVYPSVKLAHDACVAGRGDAIVLLPGTHTVGTASLALNKASVKIYGPEAWAGMRVSKSAAKLITSIAADEIANVTAQDVGFIGLTIRPITQSDAIDISTAANGFLIDGCHFDLYTPAVHTSTVGVTLAACSNVVIKDSVFLSDGAQGNAIVATGALDSFIQNCVFINNAGTWASAVLTGAATQGLLIEGCRFDCTGTAMTVGINGTGATIARGILVRYCDFGNLVTVPVDNYDAAECQLIECYKAGVGATDGGTKVVAIT